MPVSALEIIRFLEKEAHRPLSARDILSALGLKGRKGREGVRLLEALADDGTLVRLKGGRYSLPKRVSLVVGTLSVHRDGYGFVAPLEGNAPDLFIPARFVREAMNGDKVAARIEHRGFGGKVEGRIIRVLERAHKTVVGRFESGPRFGYVVPADPRLLHDIVVHEKSAMGARSGQMVLVRIDSYPTKMRNIEGTVEKIIGEEGDPEVDILAVAYRFGLPVEFSSNLLNSLDVSETVSEDDLPGRTDLRELPIVTIDGETARDFDDAVYASREEGNFRLWVCIADVAHYVREGTLLDREALERGTSVYFPGQCIPMLPEVLSNGICSINPGVDRLVMTAEILFDREGRRLESRFYPAVMRSKARLTYTEVRDMVVAGDAQTIERYAGLYPHLKVLEELALALSAMRRRRGSIDLDLPEAEILLDLRGRPEDVVRSERNLAHRIIEELMLAANEAVAAFLADRKTPLLYRVHEPPDMKDMEQFQQFVAHFNYGITLGSAGAAPRQLQALLEEAAGRPEERLINEVLLRSMKQAHYTPDNAGHFGLAADLYCHFTSPIRRYPDLTVHRVLKEVLQGGRLAPDRKSTLEKSLPTAGEVLSRLERRAMEAERDVVDLRRCQFMADRVGFEFDGIVSGVRPFGVFVELNEFFIEGLVHVSTLADDFYEYDEELQRLVGQNRRRIFSVGEPVRVRVTSVDLPRRQIDFALADMEETPRRHASSLSRRRRALRRR